MAKFRGRLSRRDTLIANKKALDYYAALAGKPPMNIVIPEKRTRVKRTSDPKKPLEHDIQKAILQLLHAHPRIHWAGRFNSGTFMDGDRYIRANSQRGLSDILAMERGTGRLIAIEVKRPGQKLLPHQQAFLNMITAGGGLAFTAYSVDDVVRQF